MLSLRSSALEALEQTMLKLLSRPSKYQEKILKQETFQLLFTLCAYIGIPFTRKQLSSHLNIYYIYYMDLPPTLPRWSKIAELRFEHHQQHYLYTSSKN